MHHMWPLMVFAVKNQNGLHGLPQNTNGILGPVPINVNFLEWWCTWSNDYGYGIFHSVYLDQTTNAYRLVHRGINFKS